MTPAPAAPFAVASLPRMGLGCAPLGNLFAPLSEAAAFETLEAAWAGGVRYFDTAPFYGHGLSEERLGRFLTAAPRPGAIVSSKVGRSLRPAGGGRRRTPATSGPRRSSPTSTTAGRRSWRRSKGACGGSGATDSTSPSSTTSAP